MNFISEVLTDVKKSFKETKQSWQSKDKSNDFRLTVLVFFIVASILLISSLFLNLTKTNKVIYIYISILLYLGSITIGIHHFYISNRVKFLKNYSNIFFVILVIFCIITFLVSIPLIVSISVFEYLGSMRAKNSNRFLYGMLHIMLILLIYSIFFNTLSHKISLFAEFLLNLIKDGFPNIDEYSFILFISLLLIKIFVNIIYYIILYIEKQFLMKEKDKQYSIHYYKNLLRKSELLALILFYIMIAFDFLTNEDIIYFGEHKNQLINIVTLTTLILLLLDKYRQWNNELKEQIKDNENN